MSDNKNINDEYQYVEESDNPQETTETTDSFETKEENTLFDKFHQMMGGSPLIRNSIIAIIGVIVLVAITKCSSSDGLPKKSPPVEKVKPIEKKVDYEAVQQQQQITASNQLMQAQQSLQASVSSLSQQVTQLSAQLNTLSSNIQSSPQELSGIQLKLNELEQILQEIKTNMKTQKATTVRIKPRVKKVVIPRFELPAKTYYIQAIIPGRAWLIGSDGSTLTVVVGSRIPGYGIVEKIDPYLSRVEVSSNRVLRFGQQVIGD